MNYLRDKHRDKERKENKEHRDKDKHHSSKSSHHDRHKDREKKVTENGVEHAIKAEPVVAVKDEIKDPLDISDYAAFSESNVNRANNVQSKMQENGIRDCYVNVSQMSETSSCDYSMSQFRADESAFSIKAEINDDSRGIGDYAGNDTIESQDDDDDDVPIAQRKKIKRELAVVDDDEDDMPLTARKKPKTEKKEKKIKREISDDEEDDYDKPKKKKIKKEKVKFCHFYRL